MQEAIGSQAIPLFETLKISCACKAVSGSIDVPTSSLPLPMTLCHCNICRHITGQLCVSVVFAPKGSKELQIRGKPNSWNASSGLIRYFCGDCGTRLYETLPDRGLTGFCTGALHRAEGIVALQQHIFVVDTKDGGLRDWLPDCLAWEEFHEISAQVPRGVDISSLTRRTNTEQYEEKVHARCYCGGVQFDVSRPNEGSSALSSPWPDVIAPYHTQSSENADDVKWWLRANGTRFLAGLCACNSCRIGSGYDIQAWAFIPKSNILQANGESLDFSMGTLKQYKSSRDTYREFCRTCGATIFWHCEERPDLIDVSVGLLDAESGARAEDWLEWWTERVSFEEFAQNKPLIASLSAGLKAWGKRKSVAA